jgi:phage-related protein
MKYRQVIFYKQYFEEFFEACDEKVQNKILYVLRHIEETERISKKFFKHIENTDGLYEVRVEVENNQYRVFSFFDEGKLIVLANGFKKKKQKTPKSDIRKALRIKKEYQNGK